MHDLATVRAVLRAAPFFRLSRQVVARFIFERYRPTPASPIGAKKTGGRYNPLGTQALYTSFTRTTALAEFTQFFEDSDPIEVAARLSIGVKLDRVLDLTTHQIMTDLGTSVSELTQARIPRKALVTQDLGREAAALDIHGKRVSRPAAPRVRSCCPPDRGCGRSGRFRGCSIPAW